MLEGQVTIVNVLGLHARAAAQLVKTSVRFKSSITLSRLDGSDRADTRSMLDVLSLAAPVKSVLTLQVSGEDEDEAFRTVNELISSGFGEL